MDVPAYPLPRTMGEWRRRRAATGRTLESLLGRVRPRPDVSARRVGRALHPAYVREDLELDAGGACIPAALVLPRRTSPPHPAILYHHSHFGDYAVGRDELFQPWPVRETPAAALARRGFAVLAIDAWAFGARRGRGPGGPREQGRAEETSLAKLFLWQGTSLWAMMLRDDLLALEYLANRPEIDARRMTLLSHGRAVPVGLGFRRSRWTHRHRRV